MRYAVVFLFIVFFYFLGLNNLFIILFLIECQSVLTIYLLISAQQTEKLLGREGENNIHRYLTNVHFMRLTLLFFQFWVIFSAALLFILTVL